MSLEIRLHDGKGQPFLERGVCIHVRRKNGEVRSTFPANDGVSIPLPDEEPVGVVASRDGYRQCGYLVSNFSQPVHLMLLPNGESIDFEKNLFARILDCRKEYACLLRSDPDCEARLKGLQNSDPKSLACLMNVLEAIRWLPNAAAVIRTLTAIEVRSRGRSEQGWRGLQQDRIFALANPELVNLLCEASKKGDFESANTLSHAPADRGFKERGRFGEANLNFSIISNPNDLRKGEEGKVRVDIDLDYFDDKAAHMFLEVIPNWFSTKVLRKTRRTNPAQVYALRWMATKNCVDEKPPLGKRVGRPDFNPLFGVSPG